MSPPRLYWRVDAHDSLGHGSEYWRQLLVSMVVKFTHQLGKKCPRAAFIQRGTVTFEGDLDNVKRRSLPLHRDGECMEMRMQG
jgi:hypothetical protein